MKTIGAVEIADRAGDRGEIGLRNLLADIGLVDRSDAIGEMARAPLTLMPRSTN